jgi:hypothetical protein
MFRPLMWPSSVWWEQEYKYNYNVPKSTNSQKSHNFWLISLLKEYNMGEHKALEDETAFVHGV